MPQSKLGRTKQLTIRLRPEDAAKLSAIAERRRMAQTALIEEWIRSLPEPSIAPAHGEAAP